MKPMLPAGFSETVVTVISRNGGSRFGLMFLLLWLGTGFSVFAQPSNDDCANAQTLTVGVEVCSESTNGGSTQSGEVRTSGTSCLTSTFTESVWYEFTATSSQMYVSLRVTGLAGSGGGAWCPLRLQGLLYDTGSCLPGTSNILDCDQHGGDDYLVLESNSLVPGNSYLIQIGYNTNNGCKTPEYCITVDDIDPACNTCSSYCGPACEFSLPPTVQQVTSSCPEYELHPVPEGGDTLTKCVSFYATDTVAEFNVVISSTCGTGGNVSFLEWELYPFSCSSVLQSGDLNDLEFNNLNPGNQYRFCYTVGVPASCNHTSHYPYVISSAQLLAQSPILDGADSKDAISLSWSVTDLFAVDALVLERSIGGKPFEEVLYIPTTDEDYFSNTQIDRVAGGENVFRLKCRLKAGYSEYSNIVSFSGAVGEVPTIIADQGTVYCSWPSKSQQDIQVHMYNIAGSTVYAEVHPATEGSQSFTVPVNDLPAGLYFVTLQQGDQRFIEKIFHH